MKKFLLSIVGLTALATAPVMAADMPVKYKAPPPVPYYNWSGFYIGGNLGAAWTRDNVTTTNTPGAPVALFATPANIAALNAAGTGSLGHDAVFTGGFQAGYNWQVSPAWVFGLEADINSLRQTGTLSNIAPFTAGRVPGPVTNELSTRWLATARARLGVTFNNWLVYATGGVAFTNQTYTETFGPYNDAGAGGLLFATSSASNSRAGWTVGGGVEAMLAGNWSVKAEYLYARFQGLSTATTVVSPAGFTQFIVGSTDHLDVQIARIGLNYRFGGGKAPVVANY